MKNKQKLAFLTALIYTLTLSLSSCSDKNIDANSPSDDIAKTENSENFDTNNRNPNSEENIISVQTTPSVATISETTDDEDISKTQNTSSDNIATLNGTNITFGGKGATANASTLTVTSAGIYKINGTLNDGQIIVDSNEKGTVNLVLSGVDITSLSSAPIYIINAEKVIITLEENTKNVLTDGSKRTDENISSVIYSKDDLVINGAGALKINANFNDGISCNDTLKILGGVIDITSADDGIVAKDFLAINGGNIKIEATGDGLKSTNDTDLSLGYIAISDGIFDITAGADGIQAETDILIENGTFTINTGGGSGASSKTSSGQNNWRNWEEQQSVATENSSSTKGLKAQSNIIIKGGSFNFDTCDDAIHSNSAIEILGGNINISSGDDGIHSDTTLIISNGEINIAKSFEGIESSLITITGGTINIVASDDGINISGGADSSSMGGRPGQNNFNSTTNDCLQINGGKITVDASGDGLDSNGNIYITGGEIYVNGPTNSGNAAFDFDGEALISGGTLVAVGSAGMAQSPSSTSSQSFVSTNISGKSGDIITLKNSSGETLLTYETTKDFGHAVISCSEIINGEEYTVTNGSTSLTAIAGTGSSGGFGNFGGGGMAGGERPGGQERPNGHERPAGDRQPPNDFEN